MIRSRSLTAISLLEIVIAMFCTAILLVMLSRTLPMARRQVKEADQRLGGALMAQNVMEEYLSVPFQEWPSGPIAIDGSTAKAQLEREPWERDSRLTLCSVTILRGQESVYRLETVVQP